MKKIYIKNINDIKENEYVINLVKYSDNEMKKISLKAWSLLSEILLKEYSVELTKDNIHYNDCNKPYLKNSNIYFNISHSRNLIAIIIDEKECGIDIEYIDYSKDISKICKRVLSNKEQKLLKFKINKYKYFYKLWTKKEAFYKKQGSGINYKQLNNDIKYENIKSYIVKNKNEKYYVSFSK